MNPQTKPQFRLVWMQGVLSGLEQHLCIQNTADGMVFAALCGHKWLVNPREADLDTVRCEECDAINRSGNEIALVAPNGMKLVLRPKLAPVHVGSLDPFQDAVEALAKTGALFCLSVCQYGQSQFMFWTNANLYPQAVDMLESHFNSVIQQTREKRENDNSE